MEKPVYMILLVFLLWGCGREADKSSSFQYQFTGESQSVQLPEHWDQFSLVFRSSPDGTHYMYDYKANEILVDFWGEDRESVLITLGKEGPDGVGEYVEDFQVDLEGGIWLSSSGSQLVQVDMDGKVIRRIALPLEELHSLGYSLMNSKFVPEGNDIFAIPAFPLVFDWTQLGPSKILEMPNAIRIDGATGGYEVISRYDSEFIGNNLNKNIIPSLHRGAGNKLLLNQNFRDIWVLDGQTTARHTAAHSRFPAEPPSSTGNMFEDLEEVMRIVSYADSYVELHYLTPLKLYVRLAKYENIPGQQEDQGTFFPKKFGMVFLNEDFTVVGELDLPAGRYNPNFLYATEEGIWIGTSHPDNPEVEEGVISFELIKIRL